MNKISGNEFIKVVEVGPRDGLQNEAKIIATTDKAKLIQGLVAAGLQNIEITSFVSPKWIPQLADNLDLVKLLDLPDNITTLALVRNQKGYEIAKQAKIKQMSFFMSATQSHSKKNINKSIEEALEVIKGLASAAKEDKIATRAYVSCAFFCPYEGKVDFRQVTPIISSLIQMGIDEISVGDTIGYATPRQVNDLLHDLINEVPVHKIAMHFHDTFGMALANVYASIESGVRIFDTSFGGMGGCPYAPGASGNLATEDLVYLLDNLGFKTSINLNKLMEVSIMAENIIGRSLPSKYLQANKAKNLHKQEVK